MVQNFSEFPRIFQNFPEFPRIFQNFPESSRIIQNFPEFSRMGAVHCLLRMALRLPVTAWKPVLMVCTEHLEWHDMHWRNQTLVSLLRMVSGERHVWHVTNSLMYLLSTFSMCFCWKRPLRMSWSLPSMAAPGVPSSAVRKDSRCFGCRWSILAISVKLTKAVFLVPTLTTCGGRITNFFFSPAT